MKAFFKKIFHGVGLEKFLTCKNSFRPLAQSSQSTRRNIKSEIKNLFIPSFFSPLFFPPCLRASVRYICKFLVTGLFLCFILSCNRVLEEAPAPDPVPAPAAAVWTGAAPLAILQTGEYPLWFQLTEDGPAHIESIEDAINTAAFIPWPLALHVRFFLEREEELFLAVNRDGFMKLAPYSGSVTGIVMYRFSGGEFWRQYTVGGFVFYDDKPAALLYLDDRFLDTNAPLPRPYAWSFNMESNRPFPLDIPALQPYSPEEGWSVDTLRSFGGLTYYRAIRKSGSRPAILMFRTENLNQAGEEIPIDVFYSSAPHETEITRPLPPLPEGFVYTGIGRSGDSLFAFWEEQDNFYIGAAGFMVIKN